jgi:mRNA interferase MazF
VTRGDIYLVKKPGARDPKRQRAYVVLSRHALLQSRHSSVVCAPVYSQHDGLSTQVLVGIEEGLKHDSSIHCDDLVSLPKSGLTHYLGPSIRGRLTKSTALCELPSNWKKTPSLVTTTPRLSSDRRRSEMPGRLGTGNEVPSTHKRDAP